MREFEYFLYENFDADQESYVAQRHLPEEILGITAISLRSNGYGTSFV